MTSRQRSKATLAASTGGVAGALAFFAAIGQSVLGPQRLDWILLGGLDPSVHFVGWHMYRHEAWSWPLGAIRSFGYPVGTSIALTDSMPIVAIPLKLGSGFLTADFQYLGIWLLASFVLQGVFAALLVSGHTRSLTLRALGATLFVLAPLLIHRVTHTALTAHWLVLAGLWLYFRRPQQPWPRATVWWALLASTAVATHPYLAAMVMAVAAAAAMRSVGAVEWRAATRALAPLAVSAVAALVTAWQVGYFVVDDPGDLQGPGLGLLSMNLWAPLMPLGWSTLFGEGPIRPASPAQNEGYAYAGAGTLLLAAVLVPLAARWSASARASAARHWPLIVVCAGLTVVALSPTITAGTRTLVAYDAQLWGPLQLFRASGRMFWPVYYLLTLTVIVCIIRSVPPRAAAALLAAAVLVQAADVSGAYDRSRSARAHRLPPSLPSQLWDVALPHYEHMVLYPTNMCRQPDPLDWRIFAIRGGRVGLTLNAGFAARYDAGKVSAYCREFAAAFDAGSVSDAEIYVMRPQFAEAFVSKAAKPTGCTTADGYAVCFTRASYARWQSRLDVGRLALPSDAEFDEFRAALEADYRDRLRRSALTMPGSPQARTRALARYLAYRSLGCDHAAASADAIARSGTGQPDQPCVPSRLAPSILPQRNESMQFARDLLAALADRGAAHESTHVDVEGEVVWLHEYAAARLAGRSHGEATAAVLSQIRAVAP
jgi:hypothetical protein